MCGRSILAGGAMLAFAALAAGCSAPDDIAGSSQAETELSVRAPLPAVPIVWRAGFEHRIVVKFRDELRARLDRAGTLTTASGDIADVDALAIEHRLALAPLLRLPEPVLLDLQRRAEQRALVAAADLAGIYIAHQDGASPQSMIAAAEALSKSAAVEYVFLEPLGVPPPGDIAPPSALYDGTQAYRSAATGIDGVYATAAGATGKGVRVSDCEYAWNAAHEDLSDISIHPEPGQTPTGLWQEHGTAVLGEIAAVSNGYGMTGLVPDVELHTYSESTVQGGYRRAEAIAAAAAGSRAGDVVLLEMQTAGGTGHDGPAEWDPAVWMVTKTATDAGVIVVAAAGNGGENLDSPAWASYRARGDSGAIIVGAGVPGTRSRYDKWWQSSYGSRVNVQGWGEQVATLAYGDLFHAGGDDNQDYTAGFSGTSSASPIVTSAVAALQQRALDALDRPLTPAEMRALLIDTGRPQPKPENGHIGPLPDLHAALDAIGTAQAGSPLLIAEVGYDVAGDDAIGEFVVLYNRSPAPVSLDGWSIADNHWLWPLPAGLQVQPGEAFAIARDRDGYRALTGDEPGAAGLRADLGNAGDWVTLRGPDGSAVDFVAWEGAAPDWNLSADTGEILHRLDPTVDSDTESDWAVSEL